ncbi:MAG: hypothetical protein JWM44_2325 [Bacilli bacterium]|nr:hypothetical protein [Bacilli bacterium]
MLSNQGVVKIFVKGTQLGSVPGLYYNNVGISSTAYQNLDYVTDSTGLVIGKIHYRAFDLSSVGTGTLTTKATNYYSPYNVLSDSISIH